MFPAKTLRDVKTIAETPEYLVADKPSGMLTHATSKMEPDALAEILLQKYPAIKKVGDDPLRPGIVHRLDRDASGLLVVAKTNAMFDHLKKQFQDRTIEKEYLVLVHGAVDKDAGEIDFPISRSAEGGRMAAHPKTKRGEPDEDAGRRALTEFSVEKRFVNFTLLRVKIKTGRAHQIRAHFLAFNHPVAGDKLYYQKKQRRVPEEKLGRLFLHCTKLVFNDLNGEKKAFESPLPPELANFLKQLK